MRRDLRLLPVAGMSWAGALVAVIVPDASGVLAGVAGVLIAAALALAAIVSVRRSGEASRRAADRLAPVREGLLRLAPTVALCAVACAGFAAAAAHVAIAHPERNSVQQVLDDRVDALSVQVTTKAASTPTGIRFRGTAHTGAGSAEVSVLWRGGHAPDELDLGARVVVTGDAAPQRAGDRAVAVVFAESVEVRAPPSGLLAAASALRRGFVTDIVHGLPDPGGGLLPGLSVGETSAVTPDLDAAMKASSLSHLTAVSGANCALVVGIAYGLAALCGAARGVRVAAGLLVLGGFVLLVTPEPSVIRAATMAGIAMLALLLGRRGQGVAVLSLAVTVLMVADPWLATSYGFLLSAGATGALLLLAEPLARGLGRWMPRPAALGIAVPLAAQLVCGPIIVLFSPEVALYGVAANMIAAPTAPLATVLGLMACVTQALGPLSLGLAVLGWLPSAWIARTAEVFSEFPSARLGWPEGWIGFWLLAGIGALIVVVVAGIPPRPGRGRVWIHRLSAGTLAILIGTGAGTVVLNGVAAPLTAPDDWSIALCDVGQGDAILLRADGHVALVDAGPEVAALERCLDRLDVDEIDLAFLTHFDADHVTGVPALVDRVDTIIHGPAERPAELDDALRAADDIREGYAGMAGTLGGATWRILWPARDSRAFPPGNDTSLAIEVSGPGLPRTLLLGDLGADAQRILSPSLTGAYEVVKVSHHGSRDQFAALYERASARVALIGVGENDYGHPHPQLLSVLARTGTVVARSDTDGLVLVGADDGLTVWREQG